MTTFLFEAGKWAATASLSAILSAMGPRFDYGGKPFDAAEWTASPVVTNETDAAVEYAGTWVSPDGRLELAVTARVFRGFPVVETVPVLTCVSTGATEIVRNFRAAEIACTHRDGERGFRLRRTAGSNSRKSDFCRHEHLFTGRSSTSRFSMFEGTGYCSNEWLPWFGVDFADDQGYELALGWAGNWSAVAAYEKGEFVLGTGLRDANFRMRPGESFRLPSALVYLRRDETLEAMRVRLHRFMVSCKSPRDSKGEVIFSALPWTLSGGNRSDAVALRQLDYLRRHRADMPVDTVWMDAGWYGAPHEPGGGNCGSTWWRECGDWRVNTVPHPDGNLRKIADAAHALGCRFLVWFEPERAGKLHFPDRDAHPDWYWPKDATNAVFRFDIPEAREWMTRKVIGLMDENGIDIYRQDSNLGYKLGKAWHEIDAADGKGDRKGVAEIRHVNGVWAHFDAIRAARPDVFVENCASGGRRLDYETMSRCHAYCRDDAQMWRTGGATLSQNITLNATPYLPFTGGETFVCRHGHTDYLMLSFMSAGTVFTPLDFDVPMDDSKPERTAYLVKHMKIADRMRDYYYRGDFHELIGTEGSLDLDADWCGWQVGIPGENQGFFIVFRRPQNKAPELRTVALRGVDPARTYALENADGEKREVRGADLRNFEVALKPGEAALWFYR